MASIERYFRIQASSSPGKSAAAFVPLVIGARALSFVRALLVAKILGNLGQREFGIYQPALELINWIVPLVMFGLGDVAERYVQRFEAQGHLAPWLKRQIARLLAGGVVVGVILVAASPFLARAVFKLGVPDASAPARENTSGPVLLAACAAVIVLLALYQYIAAVLRGLRAYAPAAAMEFTSAVLFLVLSCVAAWRGGALALIYMYGVSVLIPALYFGSMLAVFLKTLPSPVTAAAVPHAGLNRFAAWALVRLLLVMSFGFLSVWGVGHLAQSDPHAQTAAYTMPFRIAQLLAYVGITIWTSTYAFAARAWSGEQTRRAKVQLFRAGKFGAAVLTLLALALLLARSVFAALLPSAYAGAIFTLLPPLLAVFIWYALLAFASMYGDLQEKPQRGACLWAVAVVIQLAGILLPSTSDPAHQVLFASALGLAIALFVLAPVMLWHPFNLSATAVPMVVFALAPLALFSPAWIVDTLAPLVMLAGLAFIFLTGLFLRPIDRRTLRRMFSFFRKKTASKDAG